jgi:hypothetical protein
MVIWVHCRTTNRWPDTQVSLAPSLAELDMTVLDIANLSNRRQTVLVNQTLLTRWQSDRSISSIFFHQNLGRCTSSPDHLTASANLHLDVVNERALGNIPERQCITRLDFCSCTANDGVIDVQTKRSDNVPFLPIQVVDQGDSSRPVGIILN